MSPDGRIGRWLGEAVEVRREEVPGLAWATLYFFSLLCGYYVIRPLRDTMGIAGGVGQLQWMFTATFVAMLAAVPLFGWVSSRWPRRRFLPAVYVFFALDLLVFHATFRSGEHPVWAARAFFVWASVYNLFIVSVFWSFMADLFTTAQAKRLFGPVAAGGTAGAIAGPTLTAALAEPLGTTNLLLVSAAFLGVAVVCIRRLAAWSRHEHPGAPAAGGAGETALGGSVLAGFRLALRSPYLLGICALMLLLTTLATFLYFQQAHVVKANVHGNAARTALFAAMDLAVNLITLGVQVFLTGRLAGRFGLAVTLVLVPVLLGGGFAAIALAPVLPVLVVVQVLRRAGNYAVMRPAREMLFTVLAREEKYKAKSFIDTAVYRGGDAVSAWAYAGLSGLGLGVAGIAAVAVPLAALWAAVSWYLGRACEARTHTPIVEEPA